MQEYENDLLEILESVDPSTLSYQEWTNIGMALKHEGYTAMDWEQWSARDSSRYHAGECFKKWDTFQGTSSPVTGGTIVQYAKENGWTPPYRSGGPDYELDWDSTIKDELVVVDPAWVEGKEIKEPKYWKPVKDLVTYLSTLFESTDNVGYVTTSYQNDAGKYVPTKGNYDRTAGELIEQLNKCNEDIGAVLGDYQEEVGAWIRFNPLDGNGVKNDNVSEYRYALVESDAMELEKQYAIITELELPVACLVHSGKKSIHAIVKVHAANYEEYRKRVNYLYDVCKKNGLKVDEQNKNPSRLSRMPGVTRNGHKQFLIATNIGKESWQEWQEWIEAVNDDLPEPEAIEDIWENLPDLSPVLIDGILRQGHKLLMAGPSKAGKSFALIELCIAIAEGQKWLGFQCTQGRVLYVNLELDRASLLHRIKDVYTALGIQPSNLKNLDVWNLRGKSVPMDQLAPKLIRRAQKKNYIAIVIDPIYKILTGDENSADQMAHFTNQFDKVCTELGSAVIYCHHHSKGGQGNKRSMDRASGSGVFARDPDALLDLVELELPNALVGQLQNEELRKYYGKVLNDKAAQYASSSVENDDYMNYRKLYDHLQVVLNANSLAEVDRQTELIKEKVNGRTGWRIEGTLREFARFKPLNLWFDYPIHSIDTIGHLKDIDPEGVQPAWKKAKDSRKPKEVKATDRKHAIETAYGACTIDGEVTVKALAEYMGKTEKTVRKYLKEHGDYWVDEGIVGVKNS
ncbi:MULTISPECIES: AAA family ATPase [unclassified Breznakia]|uniref:AAA family ATPase n=1 Tax=unclassified Breznakia TaxID=2623764 RepID=UPI00247708D3|nr:MULTISPECIES: AAA family ATPase [unclassified Breznakia]MDH6367534.1 RecA-family ATPase [Breznakia sp. PH1-1]MDH6404672.1 RecA-family ATPase [Breznakia sp. PF1-11]MDH6412364.1 RecA-family ATPase [Breznakia sp. PFB1-11]MDH6414702.1 RecA-family ATPase [Breznakia sp. PFB1-14]MDH6417053.1 RecA-family ATPase [Breznakia sp. PFB1-4]